MSHMYFIKSVWIFIALTLLCSASAAQSTGVFFDDKAAFEKAVELRRTIDFESIAPRKGFGKYAPDVGLNAEGITFRTMGGAKFGSGTIYVPSADYTALNPGLTMLNGAHLSWGAPNQPGNAHLELTFPSGVKAVGADVWTMQPIVSPVEVTVTTRDGQTHTSTITTRKRPDSTFAGFISESEIASVRFTLAKGQSTFLMDNLAYGGIARGVDLASLAGGPSSSPSSGRKENNTPAAPVPASQAPPTDRQVIASAPASPPAKNPSSTIASSSGPPTGTIAYVRGNKEIRTISPDGSNDRRLWTHADAHEGLGVNELAWSPDGSELAFSSGHESAASFYHADIFSMKADGTGVRRITNGPDRSDFHKYGKGTVTVTVRNEQPIYQTTKASAGIFFIYVAGADLPQPLVLPPGSSRTLTFKNVADFGDHAQPIVAVYGGTRWFIPGTDVKAGQVVKAPDFGISGNGLELFGAFRPGWKRDGSRISYRSGACIVSNTPSRTSVGHTFDPIFKGENTPAPCAFDWGPTVDTADHFLYSVTTDDEIGIYRVKGTAASHPGEKLASFSKEKYQFINDLRWLPDGSGFLFTASDLAYGFANILRYDLATRQTTSITNLEDTFAKSFSVSPDGKWIVFEQTDGFVDDKADLWIVGMDGKGMRLLASKANNPAWGR
ncbi:MAG TPA: hypothetical protein VMZ26_14065 [Pyrinomonadaceae bacterium]|nr:hypothetical protein [Pyrinomonadaceae bacterium]